MAQGLLYLYKIFQEGQAMKTKIKNTLWLSVFTGVFLASNVNDTKAQDDIYYVPAKKSASQTVSSNQNISKDTSGMSDYERYRAYRDGYANKNDGKSDSGISREDIAKKKGMEQYSGRNIESDTSAYSNNNQNYSGQPSDPPQENATILNNYYDDGYYNDRFSYYHRFYFGYDPFWCDFYDPFYFGLALGYPFFGFGLGLYSPFWGFGYYRPYYGYYGGHFNGYYNHYGFNNGYANSGGIRTLSSPINRSANVMGNRAMSGAMTATTRRSASSSVTPTETRGATFDGARRRAAWQTYQTVSASHITTTRSASGNNTVNTNRSLSIPTTRLGNNTKGYSPSYSVPGSSTRRSYNSSGGNTSYSQPRRSSQAMSAPVRNSSAPSSGHSGNTSHSSGSSSSGGHFGGGGGGHHGR